MGLFKFFRKKNDSSESSVTVVEPLPVKFSYEDFAVSVKDGQELSTAETVAPEIVAAISAVLRVYLEESVTSTCVPLIRRKVEKTWRLNGIERNIQARSI